jgi:hypothetical protein
LDGAGERRTIPEVIVEFQRMQKRSLGNSNLEVSAIGFGCMGLDFGYANKVSLARGCRADPGRP